MTDLWTYRPSVWQEGHDVIGYDVEATDGEIGKIDESTLDADQQHLVVDTGFWIFGKRRLVPARAVARIDYDAERVHLDLTKDQIKEAPDFDDTVAGSDADARERLAPYDDFYGRFGW